MAPVSNSQAVRAKKHTCQWSTIKEKTSVLHTQPLTRRARRCELYPSSKARAPSRPKRPHHPNKAVQQQTRARAHVRLEKRRFRLHAFHQPIKFTRVSQKKEEGSIVPHKLSSRASAYQPDFPALHKGLNWSSFVAPMLTFSSPDLNVSPPCIHFQHGELQHRETWVSARHH
jgi:hypothetical protein